MGLRRAGADTICCGHVGPKKITLFALSRGDLEALTERLLAENAALKQAIAELRAEVATLKGLQGRPKLKPSGMDQGTEPAPDDKPRGRGSKGRKNERLSIDEERVIKAAVPAGSRFKGYQDFSFRISCCGRTSSASAASAG